MRKILYVIKYLESMGSISLILKKLRSSRRRSYCSIKKIIQKPQGT
ncbi:MAG: hypothetical protein HPY66_0990 [Firmicutes bacterium]|nr:hypothetical protein [Bacillota bacterium]